MGHEMMGEVVEVGSGRQRPPEEGRPHRRAVHDHLRRVRPVPARQLLGLRDHQPQEAPRRQGVRPRHGRPVRLHPPDRRLSRRPGRIRARAVRRRDAHQGARRPDRRAGAVPRRHLPDRLAGGRAVRHPADRHGRDLGLRPGRPDGDPQRHPARREAGRRHRPPAGAPRHGGGGRRHHHQLRRGERRRAAERADRRQGPGEVHRRRSAWRATCRPRSPTRSTTAPSRC